MRSRFILIGGCVVVALWAVGMAIHVFFIAADDPLRLDLSDPNLVGRVNRVGTTSTAIVSAIVIIVVLILLIAFAIKRSRTRLDRTPERQVSLLGDIREMLSSKYPSRSKRTDRSE
jgi:ABC-type Fe3+ transport system permease subunit